MQRFGWMGQLKPDRVQKYVDLHANTWPTVLERNTACHLQNYSIFHKELDGVHWVFSYLEYTGNDFESDMRQIAADPEIQRWWAECKPCFERLEGLDPGEVWIAMESIFYQE